MDVAYLLINFVSLIDLVIKHSFSLSLSLAHKIYLKKKLKYSLLFYAPLIIKVYYPHFRNNFSRSSRFQSFTTQKSRNRIFSLKRNTSSIKVDLMQNNSRHLVQKKKLNNCRHL